MEFVFERLQFDLCRKKINYHIKAENRFYLMLNVQIVDDSLFIRKSLKKILESDGEFTIIHESSSVTEAINNFKRAEPDLIITDIQLIESNGIEFIEWVMKVKPKPIIVLSGEIDHQDKIYYKAVELGIIDFIKKDPNGITGIIGLKTTIINAIQSIYKKKPNNTFSSAAPTQTREIEYAEKQLIVIGSSTGGPQVLEQLLVNLDSTVPYPIVIVQHMPVGFTEAFASRLNTLCRLKISELSTPTELIAGQVYIGQAGIHVNIVNRTGKLFGVPTVEPKNTLHTPSVDELFYSAANLKNTLVHAFLLTGMGSDGAKGLFELRKNGHKTYTQLGDECVVDGMPRSARELGASMREMRIRDVQNYISNLKLN